MTAEVMNNKTIEGILEQPHSRFVYYTPETAQAILKNQAYNRVVDHTKVRSYADAMLKNQWYDNGECIKFNKSGKLVDGQHRLMAIIKAQKPVVLETRYGIDDGISIFDMGKPRSLADIYRFRYSKNPSGYVIRLSRMLIGISKMKLYKKAFRCANVEDVMNFSFDNEEFLMEAIRIAYRGGNYGKRSTIQIFAYALLKDGYDEQIVSEFFQVLNSELTSPKHPLATSPILFRRTVNDYPVATRLCNFVDSSRISEIEHFYGLCYFAFEEFVKGVNRRSTYKYEYELPAESYLYKLIHNGDL